MTIEEIKSLKVGLLTILLVVLLLITGILYTLIFKSIKVDTVSVRLENPTFFISPPDIITVKEAIEYYDIHHPTIVLAQAVLESGYFRSRVAKEDHNLFGLYNSRRNRYFKFTHWTASVEAYKKEIQDRYNYSPEEDYYTFLERINYAQAPNYTNELKKIVNKLENETFITE